MVSSIFYFHPYLGEDSHLDSYFSDGLKPPTSNDILSILKQWSSIFDGWLGLPGMAYFEYDFHPKLMHFDNGFCWPRVI